jgi:GABA(A) receptor-associated protein
MTFKQNHTLFQRKEESTRVLLKYPGRVPIICEKGKQNDLPDIDKQKYLVPKDLTIGQFIYVIRKRMHFHAEEALFLLINNRIVSSSTLIGTIYHQEKDEDGFLYVKYTKENTFG